MKLVDASVARCFLAMGMLTVHAIADALYVPSGEIPYKVVRIGANGAKSDFIETGLVNPVGITFDATGNTYVSNGSGAITRHPADGGMIGNVATGQNGPTGLAIGPDGALYAAISGDNKVVRIANPAAAIPGAPTLFASLDTGSDPQGIAFDADGTLLVAAKGTNEIRKFNPNGSAPNDSHIATGDLNAPVGVLPGGQNAVVVVHNANGGELANVRLKGNNAVSTIVDQLGSPAGLAIDSAGNYYVSTTAGVVKKIAGNAATDFAAGIPNPGHLFARTTQLNLVAFKNEVVADPADTKFAALGSPIIGGGGDVAHTGKLIAGVSGVTSASDTGIWKTNAAGVRSLVAREGSPAPDAAAAPSPAVFAGFSDPVVNAGGRVGFRGTLRTGVGGVSSANASGLWAEGVGGVALVVRQGDQAVGFDAGAKYAAFQQFVYPDAGGLVFLAKAAGTGVTSANNIGLWAIDGAGVVQLVARKGDTISVNGADKKLSVITLFAKVPYSAGQTRSFSTDGALLFRGTFTDGSTALLSKDFGTSTLTVVTYKNEVVSAGGPNGVVGAKLTNPITGAVNSDGSVAYRSTLSGGNTALSSNQAVFLDTTGGLELVAQKSFIAPDSDDAIFNAFSDPAVNDLGEVGFRATLKGTGGVSVTGRAFGLWLGVPGALELVARQGDAPPSVPGTVKFSAFTQFSAPSNGGLVFLAKIAGTGISLSNNLGIWQRDASGSMDIVVRKGDKIDVDGAARTVSSIVAFKTSLFCGAQGRNVNSDGSIAVLVKFTDGYQAIFRITQP